MKICIAVPTHNQMEATFALDLAALCMFTVANFPEGTELGVKAGVGTYVHSARNDLLRQCLEEGVDYVLWLDADMRFPAETLLQLLSHRVNGIVGANYSTKDFPGRFVAIKEVETAENPGKMCHTMDDSTGIEEVEALGFGCVLMDMRSVRGMWDPADPEQEPPFFFRWIPEKGKAYGEDVLFCNRFREHGGRIFVDHDLSRHMAHTGPYEYTTGHAALSVEQAALAAEE